MRGVFFDKAHPRVVTTDAPMVMLEPLVEQYDCWLEPDTPRPPATPPVLPLAPRRVRREL